jgi:hypothetical protein
LPNKEDKKPCFLSFAIAGDSWGKVVGVGVDARYPRRLHPDSELRGSEFPGPNFTVDQEFDTDNPKGPSPDGHRW